MAYCAKITNVKQRPPEPGLLHIFKLYIAMRLAVLLSSAIVYLIWYRAYFDLDIAPYVVLFLVDLAFLIIFLGWPWPQRKLGRIHLPIALIAATMIPIIEAPYLSRLYGAESLPEFWLVFPFLLIPLILTAWQYDFVYVVIFILGTTSFELLIPSTPAFPETADVPSRVALVVTRSFLFLLIGYIVSSLVTEQRRQRRELAQANRKLVRYAAALEQLTISRERNRLARELHDTLAHTLSGLAVQLEAISTVWDTVPRKVSAMLEHALATTRAGLGETRRAFQDLRATPLEDLGLALAIQSMAENAAARGALSLQLDIPGQIANLPPEVKQTYYRVAQEALENVVLHANAQGVSVSLKNRNRQLILVVSDDGRGFTNESSTQDDQLGIKGMRERAELIGGRLEVESSEGTGTTIRLSSRELTQ
jgi:signal transduction histidine kinase